MLISIAYLTCSLSIGLFDMPLTLMHTQAPLCTGTNAEHENSCFVFIIKPPIGEYITFMP